MPADLNVQKSLKNKEFVERQAKMLFAAYSEIQDAVKQFSQYSPYFDRPGHPVRQLARSDASVPDAVLAGALSPGSCSSIRAWTSPATFWPA